jgi:hypothetical protein
VQLQGSCFSKAEPHAGLQLPARAPASYPRTPLKSIKARPQRPGVNHPKLRTKPLTPFYFVPLFSEENPFQHLKGGGEGCGRVGLVGSAGDGHGVASDSTLRIHAPAARPTLARIACQQCPRGSRTRPHRAGESAQTAFFRLKP